MQVSRSSRISWCSDGHGRALGAALLALMAGPALAAAKVDPELAARLARDAGTVRYPVILRLAHQPDPGQIATSLASVPLAARGGRLHEALKRFNTPLQAPLLQDLAARKAEQVTPLVTVNAVAAQLGAKDLRELAARPDIESIRYDIGLLAPSRQVMADPCRPARPTPRQRLPKSCFTPRSEAPKVEAARFDAKLPASPTLESIGAPQAWKAGHIGKGVTVAIVDTGVDMRHPDLVGSFRGGKSDWFDVHGEHAAPSDRHGHGTQIAGLVSGTGASGQTLGVAPGARWIAARVYNDRNVGRLSDLHRIMAWLLDPDGSPATHDTPQVALNAWGLGDRTGSCDTEFAADLKWLRMAGMHVVFAAGNGGPRENTSVSPANNSGALAVGATDGGGQLAMFTSRGVSACDARPYPDTLAPGELVRTTDLAAGPIVATTHASGTSFAAAIVAGELALLAQARPELSTGDREALLRGAAAEAGSPLLRALGLGDGGPSESKP